MPSDISEAWADRRRANEDDYFRKRDQELVEKTRRRAEDEAVLQRLAQAIGVSDEDILRDLQTLGYTEETVVLLHVVPLIEMAWVDGDVSEPERDVIIAAARARGVAPASDADRQIAQWLANPPSSVVSDGTLRVLGAMLQRHAPDARAAATRDLLTSCEAVASASGGILGFRPISDNERRALDRIVSELDRGTGPIA
jgi:hypothetical protein